MEPTEFSQGDSLMSALVAVEVISLFSPLGVDTGVLARGKRECGQIARSVIVYTYNGGQRLQEFSIWIKYPLPVLYFK